MLRTRLAVKELMPFLPDRCIRTVRRAKRRLTQEHGISLLLALISLVVLSTVGGGVAVYTSSNLRHSYSDQSTASAYHLAEAGLAEAKSRLQGADDPTASTVLTSTTRNDGSLGGKYTPAAGTGWTNPTNVDTNNSVYATNSIGAVATGANQDTTNFTLGLPTGAKILGIQVSLERLASACCNVNEVQTISETGSPTAGTFTLTGTPPGGTSKTSASIARNASAATVQTALTASTMYGTGNVSCTGGPLPTTTVTCSFVGAYASMAVSTMTFTKSGFSPSSATPVIGNPTGGAAATLQDANVQLLKAGAPVGSNKAVASTWSTTT